MYAQCPECLTVYTLDAETLGRGHGMATCGHCTALFDSLHTLTAQLPPEPFEHLPAHVAEARPPLLSVPVYRPHPAQATLEFDPDERAARLPHRRSAAAHAAPQFARAARARHGRRWPWLAGSAALALSLAAQLAWAEREPLAAQRELRPWLERACASLHCRLPPFHDVGQLSLVSRSIRPHPSVPGALIISATLRNDGDLAQGYPVVEITLSDLDENRVAMRRFRPREYIGDTRAIETGLAPGASATLVVEVQDPGKNAVAFEFRFL